MTKKKLPNPTPVPILEPMTGDDFKRFRAAMGLSVRQMAVVMGHSPYSVKHWGIVGCENQSVLACLYYMASRGPLTALEVDNVKQWVHETTNVGVPE